METGRSAGETIRAAREGWSPERIAAGDRAAVYAVATAHRLGVEDLVAVRVAAALGEESSEAVRLARWFDAATFPLPAPLTVEAALARLDGLFEAEAVAAFRQVQPLIQPVGL